MALKSTPGDILETRMDEANRSKFAEIARPKIRLIVANVVKLCNPDWVFVSNDSEEDIEHIKMAALASGEENISDMPRHTVHWDGYYDQGRDKENTKILVRSGVNLGPDIATKNRADGLREIKNILRNIMAGRTLYIAFFVLGPLHSKFSIPCVQ